MRSKFRHIALLGAAAFALQGCASYPAGGETVTTAPVTTAEVTPGAELTLGNGPALWVLGDEDTTIYLFGTVHMLPENIDWYNGPIEGALSNATEIVTEIPLGAASDPAGQQAMVMKAMLPTDQNLRDLLNDDERAAYEAAMGNLGLPPGSFDQFKPWFAGMTLGMLPLIKAGWDPARGGEMTVDRRAPEGIKRSALETMDEQLAMFDTLPMKSQIAFLMNTVDSTETLTQTMQSMVDAWKVGDAERLALLMNEGLTDPALAKALLYDRNARWSVWIDDRLDEPGQVFVAVGAGHLAGDKSVQDYLRERGFTVTRLQ